jgi:hypothetical protein
MFMRAVLLVVAAAALAGCAGVGSSTSEDMVYIRSNGQPVSQEQLEADQSSCTSLTESKDRCMVAKGYFLASKEDATAKQAQLAQIAEDNRKKEEARIAAEKKKQAALARAARKQPKQRQPQ